MRDLLYISVLSSTTKLFNANDVPTHQTAAANHTPDISGAKVVNSKADTKIQKTKPPTPSAAIIGNIVSNKTQIKPTTIPFSILIKSQRLSSSSSNQSIRPLSSKNQISSPEAILSTKFVIFPTKESIILSESNFS
jgi:hypothetical protein